MEIITNGHPRPILYGWELTEKEREEFDYLGGDIDEHDFVRYKGEVYDLDEFERVPKGHFEGWSGYRSDSFFSGVLIRYPEDDDENVVMGWYR